MKKNIIYQPKASKKLVIKISYISFLIIFLFTFTSACKNKNVLNGKNSETERQGYLITSGSGYYFVPVLSLQNYKTDLKRLKQVYGYKIDLNQDSLNKLNLRFDTLIDLNKKDGGFPAAYIIKKIAPVRISYVKDTISGGDITQTLYLSIRYEKEVFTIEYKLNEIQVIKIMPI